MKETDFSMDYSMEDGKSIRKEMPYYLLAALLIAGHFAFMVYYFQPGISGPDTQGYFKQAELIADRGQTWFELESPLQYVGRHWLKADNNRYYSRYPAGFPLILAAAYKIGGPDMALLMNPLFTSLSLLGLFLICRRLMGPGWAIAAIVAMGVNPLAITHAYWGGAHAATSFFLIWGTYLLMVWSETLSPWIAFFTGLAWGIIPTIRYAETLYGLAVGVFILLHIRCGKKAVQSIATALAGASIPVLIMVINNKISLGTFRSPAYDLGFPLFSWQYFLEHAQSYIDVTLTQGAGFFAVLGLAGITTLCIQPDTRKIGLLFALLVIPITILYMSYYFQSGDRFLLPIFYIYVVAGLWFMKSIAEFHSKQALAVTAMVLILTIAYNVPGSIRIARQDKNMNMATAMVGQAASKNIESGAVVIASSSVQQQLDYLGKWHLADESYVLNTYGDDNYTFNPFTSLQKWNQQNRPVYWIGSLTEIKNQVPKEKKVEVIADIDLSQIKDDESGSRRGGMRGPGQGMPGMPGGGRGQGPGGPGMGFDRMGGPQPGGMGLPPRGMMGGPGGGRQGGGAPGSPASTPRGKLTIVKLIAQENSK